MKTVVTKGLILFCLLYACPSSGKMTNPFFGFTWGLSAGTNVSWTKLSIGNPVKDVREYGYGYSINGATKIKLNKNMEMEYKFGYLYRTYPYPFTTINTASAFKCSAFQIMDYYRKEKKENLFYKYGLGILFDGIAGSVGPLGVNPKYNNWSGKGSGAFHDYLVLAYSVEKKFKRESSISLGIYYHQGFVKIYSKSFQVLTHSPALIRDHYRGSYLSIEATYYFRKRKKEDN